MTGGFVKACVPAVWVCLLLVGCVTAPPAPQAQQAAAVAVPPPRVMVLVQEHGVGGTESEETQAVAVELLLQNKMPVVDRGVVQANLKKIQSILAASGDEQGASAVGMQYGADVIVRGEARAKQAAANVGGSNLKSYQGTVSLRAIHSDDGQVLATVSDTATVLALDDDAGSPKVIRVAAAKALQRLIRDTKSAWVQKQRRPQAQAKAAAYDTSLSAAMKPSAGSGSADVEFQAPPAGYEPPVTAVWRLTPEYGVNTNWVGPVTESLYASLLKSGWYRLVTREDMGKILAEHNIQASEVCDSAERAVEFGKILSAGKIIIGTASKLGPTYQVVLKQIDVESGEIEKAGQAEGQGNMDVLFRVARSAAADMIRSEALPKGGRKPSTP